MTYRMGSLVAQCLKNPPANAGDVGSNPGSGRSPGEGNSNPFYYSCMGNPMDSDVWQAAVHGVTKESHDLVTKQQFFLSASPSNKTCPYPQ